MLKVVVIGGGPAGCAAALGLARRRPDWAERICLVESRPFPRAKACGEFVSPAATAVLESFVPPAALRAAGASPVGRLVIALGREERAWALPSPGWVLSRRALDDMLLARVRAAGVPVRQPERVSAIEYGRERVTVRLADETALAAEIVIHADGSGRHDPAGPAPLRRGVIGLKCHFRPARPVDGLRMRSCRGAYVGTVQVESGEATCALVADRRLIGDCRGDGDRLMARLWPGFRPEERATEWLSCGVPGAAFTRPGHHRSFRIGNAAAGVEPVGGEGIGLALWSGARLAELLAEHGCCEQELGRVQAVLEGEYRARLRVRRPACRLAAAALARPTAVRLAWPLLGAPGLSLRPWYRLTGKPVVGRA